MTSAVIEIITLIIVILGLLFFDFATSNYVVLISILVVGSRLGWLFYKRELTLKANIQKEGRIFSGWMRYGTILLLAFGLLFVFQDDIKGLPIWLTDQEPVWFTFFHVGAQEAIFRVYLLSRLQTILDSRAVIAVLGGLLFGVVHFILPGALIVVAFTSILGTAWCYVYQRYPNFILVWLSHTLLNFAIKSLVQ
ncbi:MAG: hypothetical protein UY92_C0001G0054 [Candidatus Magasanikbacteria bacterium GW2011_GWA2_56_11]|uniref:CAAX prenyl protease 2/Lysostaphin resistance protein A-like domain-containing protein n=1 Tax=Candidatus Magasanikbacteria bacterium GW2011_GWA2_56_11 TaxID=1619044 RepID=A0A0G1YIL2_9BACT|nr:MAG: hypothetical protein UY92_C0001G0054 [Candidatus Magasanikbacteria bacterium GW2011_GWA2_56_11]